MFLSSLSFEQRKIFLGLAKQILVADDGTIDSEEEAYLRSICNEMSLGLNDNNDFTIDNLKNIFKTNEEKKLVLVELFALAYSNGEYHKNEEKFILSIVAALDMDKTKLERVEKLISQFFSTQKEIVNFIAPEEV